MNKQQMLEKIEHAKEAHIAQMKKIENVIAGKEVSTPPTVGKKECECGIWFHSNEKEIKKILGAQLFDTLDALHETWHRDYMKIYDIYFQEEKKSFFSRFISSHKIDAMTKDKAELYYSELKEDTEKILKKTEVAMRRVNALNESKFH